MRLAWVEHGSEGYWRTVDLRREVLRLPLGLDFTEEELAAESDQAHLMLEVDGEVRGCLVMVMAGDAAKMRQVAVHADSQGQGLGRLMVEESEHWASERGFREIRLHARATAVPFYQALGYRVEGSEFEEVGIPHFLMVKTV